MKVVVARSRWIVGRVMSKRADGVVAHCVLGFIAEACGVPTTFKTDTVVNRVAANITPLGKEYHYRLRRVKKTLLDMVHANDFSFDEEAELRSLAKEVGIELTFVD